MANIYSKLSKVQTLLKAPKNQRNTFGGYNYRSCEDILEAVKPILANNGLSLILTDEVVSVGDRIYVKATAKVFDLDADNIDPIVVTAFAREEETKKGMDGSQITGASSSYARKYALNGLFNIDDTKDSDATNTHGKDTKDVPLNEEVGMATKDQVAEIIALGCNVENVCANNNVPSLEDLTYAQADRVIKIKKQMLAKKENA